MRKQHSEEQLYSALLRVNAHRKRARHADNIKMKLTILLAAALFLLPLILLLTDPTITGMAIISEEVNLTFTETTSRFLAGSENAKNLTLTGWFSMQGEALIYAADSESRHLILNSSIYHETEETAFDGAPIWIGGDTEFLAEDVFVIDISMFFTDGDELTYLATTEANATMIGSILTVNVTDYPTTITLYASDMNHTTSIDITLVNETTEKIESFSYILTNLTGPITLELIINSSTVHISEAILGIEERRDDTQETDDSSEEITHEEIPHPEEESEESLR